VLRIKELWGRSVGEKVIVLDEKILRELEGLSGGRFPAKEPGCKKRTWAAWREGVAPNYMIYYSIWVLLVKDYFKWFGCYGMAGCLFDSGSGKSQKPQVQKWHLGHPASSTSEHTRGGL
jgi:hypothetical protein